MFVTPAYAQTASGGGSLDVFTILPLILIFVVFYFLMIRPQQKKVKEHKAMLGALRRGDRIVISGGIIGTVAKVPGDKDLVVEIADGVRVRVVRSMVAEVLARAEPAGAKEEDAKSGEKRGDEAKGET